MRKHLSKLHHVCFIIFSTLDWHKLYPYEDTVNEGGANREIAEAINLRQLLIKDPSAKIIIYCGYSHVYEDSGILNWGKAMAGRLKDMTGIDPYTFNQIDLVERSSSEFDNPYFKISPQNNYSVFIDKSGKPFNKTINGHSVDALIYYPPTKYLFNRPDWIFENGKTPYFINRDDITIAFPIIAKAFLAPDNMEEYTPIDVIEIEKKEDVKNTAIALFKKGNFKLQIINPKGEKQIINLNR